MQLISSYLFITRIRQQRKSNKLEIIALLWNDEFELPDGSYSVSDMQEYIDYNIQKYKTLPINPSFCLYINRIYNRLVFKIKDGYKLKLQTSEIMKLFGSTNKLIDKTKDGENVLSHKVIEVVLVQWNLVENQYQQNVRIKMQQTTIHIFSNQTL